LQYEDIKNWEWSEYQSNKFLTSKILTSLKIKHGYFNRIFRNKKLEDIALAFDTDLEIHRTMQVHGDKVIMASDHKSRINADGLINTKKNQILCIYSADCIPVLIADKFNGRVCACHAGWKGIAKRLIPKAIEKMKSVDSNPMNLIIAMGPAISAKNYPVREDVTYAIFQSVCNQKNLNNNQDHLTQLKNMGIVDLSSTTDLFKIDIRLALKYQLINEGINENQITICPLCTYDNPYIFFSRRREQGKGLQWSCIVS
tara:strand:- start:27 stop:797 length:771 start_codon:yes stop_codon:yes gene_type:complete